MQEGWGGFWSTGLDTKPPTYARRSHDYQTTPPKATKRDGNVEEEDEGEEEGGVDAREHEGELEEGPDAGRVC